MNPMHRDSGVWADKPLPDDASILAAVRSGDTQQFQMLIDNHKEGLFRYFVYQVGNAHVADGLAQDVFLSVFKAATAGSYTGQASVSTWMFSIALNRLRDFWRSSQRSRETAASAVPDLQDGVTRIVRVRTRRRSRHRRLA
jgi:RNA polymerase sigma-70 factor (ECF subfamily)